MADAPVPRVKLPVSSPRMPVQPGPNSWKQDQQKKAAEPRHGNRSNSNLAQLREELNPAAPTFTPALTLPKPRAYIQPATPWNPQGRTPRNTQNRAVTEPVATNPLFASHKVSIAGLRKKFTQQDEVIQEEPKLEAPLPITPPMPNTSVKAARVLGYYPVHPNRKTPPASAPPSSSTPEPFRASVEGSGPSISPPRQMSTPVPEMPSRRWLIENGYSIPPPASLVPASPTLSQQTHVSALNREQNQPKIEGMIVGDGKLSPTKQGTYGRMANVEVIEAPGRATSVRGVVEFARDNRGDGSSMEQRNPSAGSQYSQPIGSGRGSVQYSQPPHSATNTASSNQYSQPLDSARPQYSRPPDSAMTLPSTVYSPSNYGGIWENDPHVGYSLPPFSPAPPRFPQNPEMQMRDRSIASMASVPFMFRGSPDEVTPTHAYPGYPESHASVNTWVSDLSNSRSNSYAVSSSRPMSTSMPPPLFNGNNNFVPPPSQHPDFPPSVAPPPPELAHLEATLHHHIDNAFERLTRTVTDKHDRVMDEMIRRLEALEEKLDKGLKHQVAEKLSNLRKDVKNLDDGVEGVAAIGSEAKELVKGLETGLKKLEELVEEHGCKCKHDALVGVASGNGQGGHQSGPSGSGGGTGNHGREHTQQSSGQQHQHQQYRSGAAKSQASSGGRQSGNSGGHQSGYGGGRRSNTVSEVGDGRTSGERSGKRAYFAEMGRAIGPEPDLREHPAFVGAGIPSQESVWPQSYGQSETGMGLSTEGVMYQMPSFSGGAWYQQAYGQ